MGVLSLNGRHLLFLTGLLWRRRADAEDTQQIRSQRPGELWVHLLPVP